MANNSVAQAQCRTAKGERGVTALHERVGGAFNRAACSHRTATSHTESGRTKIKFGRWTRESTITNANWDQSRQTQIKTTHLTLVFFSFKWRSLNTLRLFGRFSLSFLSISPSHSRLSSFAWCSGMPCGVVQDGVSDAR